MKFGLRNVSFIYPGRNGSLWDNVREHALLAEMDGFYSFWLMDHFAQLPFHGPVDEPFMDAWTLLPALAAVTRRIKLGNMVSPVGYRNPALLARMVSTIDHISNGRFLFGFGAGGYQPEYKQYGFEFVERPSIRLAQMEEALRLMIAMWTTSPASFQGQYFHIDEAVLEPKPLQKPYPPILIGGTGPKITLRIAAELGDACNLWGPPHRFREQRNTLKHHCEIIGRDEGSIEKTTYDLVLCAPTEQALRHKIDRLLPNGVDPWMALVGTPTHLVDIIAAYQMEGADQLCLDFTGNDPESYALFVEEVMVHFQDEAH